MNNHKQIYLAEINQIEADFNRNLWCVLGLPFDAINMEQALNTVQTASEEKRRCFISTPNVNFLVTAQGDTNFRLSLFNSDLSLVDGAPIFAIARLMNIPLPERISGSNLIEHMHTRNTAQPLRVYFFGGNKGVGELACKNINQTQSGLIAVGFYDPGFGTIESMSTDEIISEINCHDCDFIIVSLGAKKGQAWIEANRHKLNAPLISHLGAVINFFAGTTKRAPLWVQKIGLEWCWRIYQEPYLWQRYYHDGCVFLSLLFTNVLPYWFWQKKKSINPNTRISFEIKTIQQPDNQSLIIILSGDCDFRTVPQIKALFKELAISNKNIFLNLESVNSVDGAFLGQCLILYKYIHNQNKSIKIINANKTILRMLYWFKMQFMIE